MNGKTQNRRPENSVDFPELAVDRQDGAEPAQRSTSCQQDGRNKGAYRCQLKTGTVQLRQFNNDGIEWIKACINEYESDYSREKAKKNAHVIKRTPYIGPAGADVPGDGNFIEVHQDLKPDSVERDDDDDHAENDGEE